MIIIHKIDDFLFTIFPAAKEGRKELPEIQKVGFEIAMLGRQGIDPAKTEKKYYLESITGKEFTGLQLLAYMYAAFQVIDPFLDTGLAFKKEYEEAKKLFKKREGM